MLAKNGVETEVVYPRCCGMPQLEQGDLAAVADSAEGRRRSTQPWIDKGYDVIALVPSCALMLKFEWPLIVPDDAESSGCRQATFDISEYVVDIARKEGLAPGLSALEGGVTVHLACHARAQNMGQKAAEMLRLIPDAEVAGDRALLRPRRLLGHHEGELRDRAEGRQARSRAGAPKAARPTSRPNARWPASTSSRAWSG